MENDKNKLAEPGAGLSTLEMVLLMFIKAFWMRQPSRERVLAIIQKGERQLENEIQKYTKLEPTERVLVPRPWFVEDSSRYWSSAMLFRHLCKVNGAVAKAIELKMNLLAENSENAKQRLKSVKPEMDLNVQEEIERFRESVARLISATKNTSLEDLEHLVIPHPWLKQLTYLQWLWFTGFHMQVHARQLKQIYYRAGKK